MDRFEETVGALRQHRPRPSASLVARIERLAESAANARASARAMRRAAKPRLTRRRLALALAAAVAIAAGGALVAGELGRGSSDSNAVGSTHRLVSRFGIGAEKSPAAHYEVADASPLQSQLDQAGDQSASGTERADSSASRNALGDITTGSNRLADLRATLLLQVENRDQVSKRTAQAMRIARSLSGYVVSAQVNAPRRGVASSYLELKIPAARSQEAIVKISELGKILSQEISLEDVQGTVNTQSKQIAALEREIETLEKALDDPTLTDEARSQLQVKLANDRARLSSLRVQHKQTIMRGRLATVKLTFTTGDLEEAPTEPGRIHKAIDRAWDGLSSEIAWVASALIVSSPFLVLALALGGGLRAKRRREERRLLDK